MKMSIKMGSVECDDNDLKWGSEKKGDSNGQLKERVVLMSAMSRTVNRKLRESAKRSTLAKDSNV